VIASDALTFGVHIGIGEGYESGIAHAKEIGCTAIQIFSGNPKSYGTAKIDEERLRQFAEMRAAAGIQDCVIHTPYLINLASEESKTVNNSIRLIRHDLAFAAAGSIEFVNTHLGSYGKRDRKEGFASVITALERILEDISPNVQLVLENSAGAGNLCGGTIEELGAILRAIGHPQMSICLDTAHAWAAGYDISTSEGVDRLFDLIDREITMEHLKVFHFNDTEVPLNGKKDRHWHIGEGLIGKAGFTALLERKELRGKTAILETPGEDEDDRRNMDMIRTLMGAHVA
jgi:deoxyribonuclease-4